MTSSRKGGAPGSDNFVEQLGDRLSADAPPRRPASVGGGPGPPPAAPQQVHPPVHQQVTVPPSAAFPPPPAAGWAGGPEAFEDATYADHRAHSDILPVPAPAAGVPHGPAGQVEIVAAHASPDDPFEQFEEALEGESTRIDAEHLLAEESTRIMHPADARAYFQVVSGKDLGKEYVIGAGETSVGRSIDNDVILTDIAVSRRHMLVYYDPAGTLRIRDLGSGNGSQLNGQKVHDAALDHGDRIEIGETILQLYLPEGVGDVSTTDEEVVGASFPPPPPTAGVVPGVPGPGGVLVASPATDYIPSPAGARRGGIPRSWMAAFLIVGGLIVALLGATFMALLLKSDDEPTATETADLTTRFNAGMDAMKNKNFAGAERAFEEVVAANPSDELARQQRDVARLAAGHQRDLALARQVLEDDPERAQRLARDIPADSLLRADAQAVLQEVTSRQVAALLRDGHALVDSNDVGAARRKLEEARNLDDSAEGLEALASALAEAEGAAASSGRHGRDRHASAARSSPRASTMSTRTAASASSMRSVRTGRAEQQVLALYRSGDFAAASRAATQGVDATEDRDERRRLQAMARNITQFSTLWSSVRRGGADLRQLGRARSLDQRISGGHYASQFESRLVEAHITAARAAIGRNDHPAGCASVYRALGIMSSYAPARTMAADCDRRAQAILGRARQAESSNPAQARELYGQVMQMSRQGSPTYTQAYQRRNSLARAGQDEDE